jgi:hypothetical protein
MYLPFRAPLFMYKFSNKQGHHTQDLRLMAIKRRKTDNKKIYIFKEINSRVEAQQG